LNGERPDNLSQRLYGTPDYYWTFFIANDDLKTGLSSWPKSDSELSQHTTNQFKNLSAFRFPLIEDAPSAGDRTAPLGIPITNGYLPYLRLCYRIDTFVAPRADPTLTDFDQVSAWWPFATHTGGYSVMTINGFPGEEVKVEWKSSAGTWTEFSETVTIPQSGSVVFIDGAVDGSVARLGHVPVPQGPFTEEFPLILPFEDYYRVSTISPIVNKPVQIFATAKIVDFKPNLSQIWIDNSTFTWSSDVDISNTQVGDGGTLDKKYSAEAKTAMFNASTIEKEFFSIQFFEDSSTPVGLKSEFIEEVRETAIQLQPSKADAYRNMALSKFEKSYTITNSQSWKDGKTAPAYYYDSSDINNIISEYMTGPASTSYVSHEEEIIEENNDRQTIKVIAPPYIGSFARDYKSLLNE
jgi:hypothetical protein